MAYIYSEAELQVVDQKLRQETFTNNLITPGVTFLDGRVFKVKDVEVSGYQPHTRNKGFNPGVIAQKQSTYEISFDRDVEFYVDRADVDETQDQLAAASVTRKFIEDKAAPETDAYRISRLAWFAQNAAKKPSLSGHFTTETITPANAYTRLKDMILPLRKYGPGNIITYVSSEFMDSLERSPDFTRKIDVVRSGPMQLESRVSSVDGVNLVEIWDTERMMTEYDFTDGFEPTEDSKDINILMVVRSAIVCAEKFSSIFMFNRGEHSQGDGWLYQNRLYHDLFLLKNKEDAIIVSVKP